MNALHGLAILLLGNLHVIFVAGQAKTGTLNNTTFLVFQLELNFTEAERFCQDLGSTVFLARIDTSSEFEFVVETFLNDSSLELTDVWIGMLLDY